MGPKGRQKSRRPYALLSYGRGIVMFAASMIFLIWAGAYWVSEREIANDTDNAFSQASNLSRLYADTISRSLRTTDQFIQRVRTSLNEPGFDLYAWARNSDFNPASGDIVQISVADASGRMLASTLKPGPFELNVGDRPDFQAQKASSGDTLMVSDPEYGVISNRTIVKVTRPIRKPDGEFDGVVIASVAPDSLTKVFRQVDLGPNGAAMVTGLGDRILARSPSDGIGEVAGSKSVSGEPGPCYTRKSRIDANVRHTCFSDVAGAPLVVGVGVGTADILAQSELTRRNYGIAACLLSAAIMAAAFLLIREDRNKLLTADAIERGNVELEAKSEMLTATLEGVGQGVALYDVDGRLVHANKLAAGWLGFPSPEDAVGHTFEDSLRRQIADGEFESTLSPDELYETIITKCGRDIRGQSVYVMRLANGTCLQVKTIAAPKGRIVRVYSDVTESLKAEAALEEKTLFLETVLESTGEGILVFDRDQRLRLVNKRAAALARLPPEAIVGLKIGDFVAMTLEDSGGDTSRSRVDAILERFIGGPDITVGVRRHELAADLVLEIRTNSLGEDGWVMVTSDVTAAHRNAEALRESEAVLKEKSTALEVTLDNIDQGILTIDPAGKVAVRNRRLPALLGVPPELLAHGAPIADACQYRVDNGCTIDGHVLDLRGGMLRDWPAPATQIVRQCRLPDGRDIEEVLRPLLGGGIVMTARDVTRQRAAEAALEAAKEAAEAGNRAKTTFVATMSHEIRTPLNGVIGMSEVLSGTRLDDRQRECLATIRECGDALLSIVSDVLDFSKLEAGRTDFVIRPFDVSAGLRSVVDIVAGTAMRNMLTIDHRVGDDVPARVLTDGSRVRQVLLNLLGNAVKFTGAGGEVLVDLAMVDAAGGPRLRYGIRDTGRSIPAEKVPLLFREFSQLDNGLLAGQGGTGLGLAISKRIVEGLGGTIGYSSDGGGNLFWFEIPCTATTDEADPAERSGEPGIVPLRVLLAEDNKINLDVAIAFLKSAGHSVMVAQDGRAALEMARTTHPDVILMDVQLPVMDGPEVTRAVRKLVGRPGRVPIVAITADASETCRTLCFDAGMDAFLTKPFNADGLLRTVSSVAWRRRDPVETPQVDEVRIDALIRSIGVETTLRLADECEIEARSCCARFAAGIAPEGAARELHNLKGSAKALGLMGVVAMLEKMETEAVDSAVPDMASLAEAMQASLAKLRTLCPGLPRNKVA
jgi:signal transduction histidine kinase/FixJ family two-component response regulator/HPt (histidine-containing phosphotransfer) domain-containing protein